MFENPMHGQQAQSSAFLTPFVLRCLRMPSKILLCALHLLCQIIATMPHRLGKRLIQAGLAHQREFLLGVTGPACECSAVRHSACSVEVWDGSAALDNRLPVNGTARTPLMDSVAYPKHQPGRLLCPQSSGVPGIRSMHAVVVGILASAD